MDNFEKFNVLQEEKKVQIMNAAMDEFVKGGYEKASMNRLVEKAGISKGSLFYYFTSKKDLYLFLFRYCETLALENARRQADASEHDFIRRMKNHMQENIKLLRTYPNIYAFMRSCKTEMSEAVRPSISQIMAESSEELFGMLYRDIDKSLFIEGVDVEMAMFAIKASMFQIVHESLSRKSILKQDVIDKLDACERFFRMTVYRQETDIR